MSAPCAGWVEAKATETFDGTEEIDDACEERIDELSETILLGLLKLDTEVAEDGRRDIECTVWLLSLPTANGSRAGRSIAAFCACAMACAMAAHIDGLLDPRAVRLATRVEAADDRRLG